MPISLYIKNIQYPYINKTNINKPQAVLHLRLAPLSSDFIIFLDTDTKSKDNINMLSYEALVTGTSE